MNSVIERLSRNTLSDYDPKIYPFFQREFDIGRNLGKLGVEMHELANTDQFIGWFDAIIRSFDDETVAKILSGAVAEGVSKEDVAQLLILLGKRQGEIDEAH